MVGDNSLDVYKTRHLTFGHPGEILHTEGSPLTVYTFTLPNVPPSHKHPHTHTLTVLSMGASVRVWKCEGVQGESVYIFS